jgi:hypothetical protein
MVIRGNEQQTKRKERSPSSSFIFDLTFRRSPNAYPADVSLLRCVPPLAFDHVHTSSASHCIHLRFVIFAHF